MIYSFVFTPEILYKKNKNLLTSIIFQIKTVVLHDVKKSFYEVFWSLNLVLIQSGLQKDLNV